MNPVYYRDMEIFTCPAKTLLTLGGLTAVTLLVVGIIGALYALHSLIPIKATYACLATGGFLLIVTAIFFAILLSINHRQNNRVRVHNAQINDELSTTHTDLEKAKQALAETQTKLLKEREASEVKIAEVENNLLTDLNKTKHQANAAQIELIQIRKELLQYQGLPQLNPPLPDQVTIEFGKAQLVIDRDWLKRVSDKLHAMISHDLQENLSCKIVLIPRQGRDHTVCADFLKYLDTKNPKGIHGQNVLALLALSREHCVPSLEKECTRFIIKILNHISLPNVLQCALDVDAADVVWVCMTFVAENWRSHSISQLLKNDECSDQAKEIVKWGIACGESGISLAWNKKTRHVKLLFDISYQEPALKILKEIQKRFHITALSLKGGSYEGDKKTSRVISADLNELAFMDTLDTLEIGIMGEKIKSLPLSWLSRVQRLQIYCSGLTHIEAPEVLSLKCDNCSLLKTVRVPKSQRVVIERCSILEKLSIHSECKVSNSLRPDLVEIINSQ